MTPVDSSSIAAVGHDPATSTLKVQFKSGDTYHYKGVSADAHASLLKAKSIGSHFQTHVRPKYKGALQK